MVLILSSLILLTKLRRSRRRVMVIEKWVATALKKHGWGAAEHSRVSPEKFTLNLAHKLIHGVSSMRKSPWIFKIIILIVKESRETRVSILHGAEWIHYAWSEKGIQEGIVCCHRSLLIVWTWYRHILILILRMLSSVLLGNLFLVVMIDVVISWIIIISNVEITFTNKLSLSHKLNYYLHSTEDSRILISLILGLVIVIIILEISMRLTIVISWVWLWTAAILCKWGP